MAVVMTGNVSAAEYSVQAPQVVLSGVPARIAVSGAPAAARLGLGRADVEYRAEAGPGGHAVFTGVVVEGAGAVALTLFREDAGALTPVHGVALRVLPGWISIVPPLVAIAMALLLRSVIPALVLGI